MRFVNHISDVMSQMHFRRIFRHVEYVLLVDNAFNPYGCMRYSNLGLYFCDRVEFNLTENQPILLIMCGRRASRLVKINCTRQHRHHTNTQTGVNDE